MGCGCLLLTRAIATPILSTTRFGGHLYAMFNKLKAAGKSLAAGDLKGAQANLNDIKGPQPHDSPSSELHPAPETANPPPQGQEGAVSTGHQAAATDHQAADLNKVKDGLSKIDLHAAINVARDLQRHNVHGLAHDAAHLQKVDPNAPQVPEAERLAKEQKKSNMKGALRFFKIPTFLQKDLKHGNLLNATEDALNLNQSNAQYQQQAEELARQKEAEASQAPAQEAEVATAHAVAAQAVAVQTATASVTNHPAQ